LIVRNKTSDRLESAPIGIWPLGIVSIQILRSRAAQAPPLQIQVAAHIGGSRSG